MLRVRFLSMAMMRGEAEAQSSPVGGPVRLLATAHGR